MLLFVVSEWEVSFWAEEETTRFAVSRSLLFVMVVKPFITRHCKMGSEGTSGAYMGIRNESIFPISASPPASIFTIYVPQVRTYFGSNSANQMYYIQHANTSN